MHLFVCLFFCLLLCLLLFLCLFAPAAVHIYRRTASPPRYPSLYVAAAELADAVRSGGYYGCTNI